MSYNYLVNNEPDNESFEQACEQFEKTFPHAQKPKMLIDVDGTMIQEYVTDDGQAKVINDIFGGYVALVSDFEICDIPYRSVEIELG